QMPTVERLNQVELFTLFVRLQTLVAEVRNRRLGDRSLGRTNGCALVHGRQKRAAVILHATMSARRRDRDERRQTLVVTSQAVADPGPDARPDEVRLAGVQP